MILVQRDYFWHMKLFRTVCTVLAAALVLQGTRASAASAAPSLTRQQMIDIMVDMELSKALVQRCSPDEATTQQWVAENAQRIYQAYDTTAEAFQDSYHHYLVAHPEVMVELYEAVVEQLEKLFADL